MKMTRWKWLHVFLECLYGKNKSNHRKSEMYISKYLWYHKKDKDRRKDCSCLWLIVAVVAIALAFFVGVLVAALTGIIATLGVGAIIAIVVVLAVLLVVTIISVICCKKDDRKKKCCCYND